MLIRSRGIAPAAHKLLQSFCKPSTCSSMLPSSHSFSTTQSMRQQQHPKKSNDEVPKPPDWDKFVDALRNAQQTIGNMVPMTFSTISDPVDGMRMWLFNLQKTVFQQVDKDFNEEEFLQGARQAFLTVRPLLVAKDTATLQPMLSEKCYEKVSQFLSDYLEKNGLTLVGHVEELKKVEIYNIRMRETDISEEPNEVDTIMGALKNFLNFRRRPTRLDTIINVRYVASESIAFLDQSGKIVVGHTDVKDRISVWCFERESLQGNWRIRPPAGRASR